MKTIARKAFIALLVVSVLVVTLLVFLNTLIEKNRERIQEEIQEGLGRPVAFDRLRVDLRGGLGLSASKLRIAEDPRFAVTPFVRAEGLRMQVRWLPLLLGKIVINRFILDEPEIQIIKNGEGLLNLSALASREGKTKKVRETGEVKTAKTSSTPAFFASAIRVRNGSIDYLDRSSKEPVAIRVRNADLDLRDLGLAGTARIRFAANLFDGRGQNVSAEGRIGPFQAESEWFQQPLDLRIHLDSLPMAQLTRAIPALKQALPASLISEGPLDVAGEFKGSLANFKAHTRIKAEESEIRYGNWLKKTKGVPAQLEMNVQRQEERLVFEESNATIHNLKLKFSGSLDGAPTKRLTLRLRTDGMDLSGWDRLVTPLSPYSLAGKIRGDLALKKTLGLQDGDIELQGAMDLDDVQVKEKKSGQGAEKISGRLSFRGKEARVENASLRLGSSQLAFEGAVPDILQPSLRYTLRSSRLNLADVTALPAYKADEMKTLTSTGELQWPKGSVALRGNLSSSEGTLQEIPYRNLRGDLLWSPSHMSFQNLSFQALSGAFRANGSWEARADRSQRLNLDSNIEAMDLKALLTRKFPKFKDHIEGQLHFKADLQGESRNGSDLPQSLQGKGETQVRAGALKDFNLVEMVLSKVTGLPGMLNLLSSRLPPRYSNLFNRRDTPFETLAASFAVEQGRIRSENLVLSTPDYTINGEGWIGFDKTVKWNAVLVMSQQFTQELMQEHKNVRYMLDRQGRLAVPFRVEGNLPHVQARPDLKGLGEAIQRGLVRKGMERALGEEKDPKKKEKRDWIQKGLEQLFGK